MPELRLPAAPPVRFVFPHAPVRQVTINGGQRMRAWYDVVSFDKRAAQDAAGILASAEAARRAREARARAWDRGRAHRGGGLLAGGRDGAPARAALARAPRRRDGALDLAAARRHARGRGASRERGRAGADGPRQLRPGGAPGGGRSLPRHAARARLSTSTGAATRCRTACAPRKSRTSASGCFGRCPLGRSVESRSRRGSSDGCARGGRFQAGAGGERGEVPPDLGGHLRLHVLERAQLRGQAVPELGRRRVRDDHRLRLPRVRGARRLARGAAPRRPRAGRPRHGAAAPEQGRGHRGAHVHQERRAALGARLRPPGLGRRAPGARRHLRSGAGRHRAQAGRGRARGADPRARGEERRARALRLHRVARPQEPADHDPRLPVLHRAGRGRRQPRPGALRRRRESRTRSRRCSACSTSCSSCRASGA